MPQLPNLIIPGAPKAGTTSFCDYLNEHPDIFVPEIKETRFFIRDEINSLPDSDPLKKYIQEFSLLTEEKYLQAYAKREEKILADASVQYMYYHATVIPQIKKILGDPKIIILLRNPVTAAFSNYLYLIDYSSKNVNSFEEECRLEPERIKAGWNSFWFTLHQRFYYEQVKSYMESFSNVEIILFEEFVRDKTSAMNNVFDFLEVKEFNEMKFNASENRSGNPKNRFLQWLVFKDNVIKKTLRNVVPKHKIDKGKLQKMIMTVKDMSRNKKSETKMSEETREGLNSFYREDILKLQDLIKKDLSVWK